VVHSSSALLDRVVADGEARDTCEGYPRRAETDDDSECTVAPGDALFAIGDRFCMANASTIATLNHTRTIQPGEVLLLHPDSSIPWVPYYNPVTTPAGYQQIPYQLAVEAMSAAAHAGDLERMRGIFANELSGLFPDPAEAEVIARALDAGDVDVLRQMFA
jgi:hypothetical protein